MLSGYADDGESSWHVNSAEHVTAGDRQRAAIILQAADKQDHWLTIAIEQRGDEWEIDDFAAFEGRAPTGTGDAGKAVDPSDIEILEIQ